MVSPNLTWPTHNRKGTRMIITLIEVYLLLGIGYSLTKLVKILKASVKTSGDWLNLVMIIVGWPVAAWLEYKAKD